MRKKNLGIYMIITKEIKKADDGKKTLLKEKMIFADQRILSDDQT